MTTSASYREEGARLQEGPVHLTRAELAERLGVTPQVLAVWKMNGYGPKSFKAGKFVRYPLAEVEAWETDQLAAENR